MYIVIMSNHGGIFFTYLGCMDGRTKEPAVGFGRKKFNAMFADTITEAGLDKLLANVKEGSEVYNSIKNKIRISLDKHGSRGIIIEGHEDCAGNPVDKKQHFKDIRASVEKVRIMFPDRDINVCGIYVKLNPEIIVERV